jgi:hypothetical protein
MFQFMGAEPEWLPTQGSAIRPGSGDGTRVNDWVRRGGGSNKQNGAALSAAPSVSGQPTGNSITVNTLTVSGGQSVQYAISTTNADPIGGWQSSPNFTGLLPNTEYFVSARSAANDTHNAGAIRRSAAIRTAATGGTPGPTSPPAATNTPTPTRVPGSTNTPVPTQGATPTSAPGGPQRVNIFTGSHADLGTSITAPSDISDGGWWSDNLITSTTHAYEGPPAIASIDFDLLKLPNATLVIEYTGNRPFANIQEYEGLPPHSIGHITVRSTGHDSFGGYVQATASGQSTATRAVFRGSDLINRLNSADDSTPPIPATPGADILALHIDSQFWPMDSSWDATTYRSVFTITSIYITHTGTGPEPTTPPTATPAPTNIPSGPVTYTLTITDINVPDNGNVRVTVGRTGFNITPNNRTVSVRNIGSTTIRRGDVNGDGRVDIEDVLLVLDHIFEVRLITGSNAIAAADVNNDGRIDIEDVLLILDHIFEVRLLH